MQLRDEPKDRSVKLVARTVVRGSVRGQARRVAGTRARAIATKFASSPRCLCIGQIAFTTGPHLPLETVAPHRRNSKAYRHEDRSGGETDYVNFPAQRLWPSWYLTMTRGTSSWMKLRRCFICTYDPMRTNTAQVPFDVSCRELGYELKIRVHPVDRSAKVSARTLRSHRASNRSMDGNDCWKRVGGHGKAIVKNMLSRH